MLNNLKATNLAIPGSVYFPGGNLIAASIVDNAFPDIYIDKLLEYAHTYRSNFVPSTTNSGRVGNGRRSLTSMGINPLVTPFRESLVGGFENVCESLGIKVFQISTIETQLTFHGNGDFFRIHRDNTSLTTCSRCISYVYYFQIKTNSFSGGRLKIYAQRGESKPETSETLSIKVNPLHNRIVFFNSNLWHEVLPIQSEESDFLSCRGSLVGWIRTSELLRISRRSRP
jgi:Rps23 Pro-64 3,4-dihydroxylase Tpa1-like proline 4-hydroxylase